MQHDPALASAYPKASRGRRLHVGNTSLVRIVGIANAAAPSTPLGTRIRPALGNDTRAPGPATAVEIATALDLCGGMRHRRLAPWLTDVRHLTDAPASTCPPLSKRPRGTQRPVEPVARHPRDRFNRPRRTYPQCPRRRGSITNIITGEMVRAQCGALRCYSCIIGRAIRVGEAIALAEPTQALTLSLNSEEWQTIKTRFQAFGRRLRTQGLRAEYCYHVEPYRNGGTHAHLFLHGDWVRDLDVRLACESAGFGYNGWSTHWQIRADHYQRPSIDYGLKMILRLRPDNPTELWAQAETYLDLNGGRLVHNTRGFWRDAHGQACTLREAIRATRAASSGRWVFVGDAAS